MNRTKLYADEATGRSTGETVITAWVVTVLLMPMKIPDAITAGFRYIVLAMPNRAWSRGAPNTANRATRMPQPVKTSPSLIGLRFIGNGAYPSTVKKPQL